MTRIKDIKNNKTYYITYDANKCGQPIKMWLKGKEQNLLWEDKNLIQIGEHIKYSYNTEGIRTKKETEEGTTEYSLIGSKIMKMEKVTSSGKITMYFTYDQRDELQSVTESNKEYYYIKDITGNIIKIKDEEGNSIVEYKYDAYGKVEKTIIENNNISKYNPFIYKGYYYDEETELYYCNTRYYSPEIGRWISIDDVDYLDPEGISGLNLYCYCMNDPVNYSDGSGHMPEWLSTTLKIVGGVAIIAGCVVGSIFTGGALSVVLVGAAIGATAGGIGAGISTAVSGGDIHDFANAFLMSTAAGAISGAVAASPLGVGAQIGINAALGAVNYAGTQLLNGGNITLGGLLVNAGIGALCGWIGRSGWMQGQTTSAFVAFAGKNALKHVVGMVETETLLRMTLPASILGGVGGGIYGRLSSQFNPNGNFIGI